MFKGLTNQATYEQSLIFLGKFAIAHPKDPLIDCSYIICLLGHGVLAYLDDQLEKTAPALFSEMGIWFSDVG